MAGETSTTNMNLTVPSVGVTDGPAYANEMNGNLQILDSHSHTSGSGVPITPAAMSITTDLSMQQNALTNLKALEFKAQTAYTNGYALYVIGVDLYYKDGSGNVVRITQSGSVTGSSGTITGLPSGTASASFASATFVFQSATNTAANIDGASFIFRNSSASSKGLTLQPPNSMGANYTLTLPPASAIPVSGTNVMVLDSSGNMSAITRTGAGFAVLSISPSLTGTVSVEAVTASGIVSAVGTSTSIFSSPTGTAVTSDSVYILPMFVGSYPTTGASARIQYACNHAGSGYAGMGSDLSSNLILGLASGTTGIYSQVFLSMSTTGIVTMPANVASSSTTTGTLVVTGGVGVSGALNVGGAVNLAGNLTVTSSAADSVASTMTSSGTAAIVTTMTNLDANFLLGKVTTVTSTQANLVGAAMTSTGANATAASMSSPNFGGTVARQNNKNIVVSQSNATASLAIIRGTVAANGTLSNGEGFSSILTSPGQYAVSFINPFSDVPAISATLLIVSGSTGDTQIRPYSVSSTGFLLTVQSPSLGAVNSIWSFIVIGQR